tara:strand:+ start:121012 stop:121881 length:870 start_codon:yes stop_codon:yes gene_type:complete
MPNPKHFIEYALGRSFLGTLSLLPLPVVSFLAGKFGAFVATLPIKANSTARKNIQIAFPDMSAQEVRHIQYKATQNFMQTILEMPALYKLNAKNFHKHIKIEGFEHFTDKPNRLLLSAHLGNWEVLLKTVGFHNLPLAAIYRRANNPYIDKYIIQVRKQPYGILAPKGRSGGRQLLKAVREGMGAGFLNDQKMSDGIQSTFFGQNVTSASAIADLALRYDREVCPVFCKRTGNGQFILTFYPAITPTKTGDSKADAHANIQNFNNIIEEQVRANPEQWLWHHKRFPKQG